MENLREMEGGVVEGQVVHRRPEIENVAVSATIGMETLKDVLAQMGGEGPFGVVRLAMDRAGTPALLATPAQVAEQTEVFEDLCQRDLLTEEGKVHLGTGGRFLGSRGFAMIITAADEEPSPGTASRRDACSG